MMIKSTLIIFLDVLLYIIVARALLSWVIRDPNHVVMAFLDQIAEPVVSPVRNVLFKYNIGGRMLDFSPLVVIILIEFLKGVIISI